MDDRRKFLSKAAGMAVGAPAAAMLLAASAKQAAAGTVPYDPG